MRAFKTFSIGAALAISSVASGALAQNQNRIDVYHFDDDDLIGDTLSTTPPLLRVRPRPVRVMLLRPRASFVAEMRHSVEAL